MRKRWYAVVYKIVGGSNCFIHYRQPVTIIEAEMLVEMLKENGIAAFTQEASSSVSAYGVVGFGIYGVDIWVSVDVEEDALKIIEEIEKSQE